MSADNDLLLTRPMDFFKKYAISPPNDGGGDRAGPYQKLSAATEIWTDPAHTILPREVYKIDHQKVIAGKVLWADVIPHLAPEKAGGKTFKLSPTRVAGQVPIYFLPWSSGKLIEMYLPDVGADMDNIDEFPRLFFTAALSGCSVFVDGDPAKPRVVHAGIDDKLKQDAATFWRTMLGHAAMKTGVPINDHMSELNKLQYKNTPWALGYKEFLQADHRDVLTIQDINEWAAVFGMRYGRLWSFYVQRNATVSTIRIVKRSATTMSGDHRIMRGTNVQVVTQVQRGRGFLGSNKTVYVAKQQFAKPIIIESFYPQGQARIQPDRDLLIT